MSPGLVDNGEKTAVEKETGSIFAVEKSQLSKDYGVMSDKSSASKLEDEPRSEAETDRDMEALEPAPTNRPNHSAYSSRKKKFIVFMAAFAGFFSPLSANIYFPALNTLSKELHVSSATINLTLTCYMIFQGLAPSFFGELADMAGRRPVYLISFIVYAGACIGIALQNNIVALFVLRCLQSTGSSSVIALASGVVADISTSAERGMYMGWVTMGPVSLLSTARLSIAKPLNLMSTIDGRARYWTCPRWSACSIPRMEEYLLVPGNPGTCLPCAPSRSISRDGAKRGW